jgi:hypothetical protein
MRRRSLFPDKDHGCYVCGYPYVELHHVYFGNPSRAISDREGATVYLCREHHQGLSGVHGDPSHRLDKALKEEAQRRWEAREGLEGEEAHEAFRAVFYRSYL